MAGLQQRWSSAALAQGWERAVETTLGPRFDYSPARFLFEIRANVYNVRNSYIPSADGKRFLVNMTLATAAPPIHVVRNWPAGLKD